MPVLDTCLIIPARGHFSLASAQAAYGLLALYAAQFALGNKPAFAPYCAEESALGDFLAKSLQQLILRLIWSYFDRRHTQSPPIHFNIHPILA